MIDIKNYYKTLCTAQIHLKKASLNSAFNRFELSFYEAALKADPDNITALAIIGHSYTKLKMHDKAVLIDLKLASILPDDPTVTYNLACSYANLEDIESAFDALGRAVELGYSDATHMMKDPDLENLRNDPRFQAIIAKIRNGQKPS
ncbi:MAG: hypothetical protein HZA48_01185 [Planctomycetes bacterium]|nr:hypothetical protein [Planctomycetota bacterium]